MYIKDTIPVEMEKVTISDTVLMKCRFEVNNVKINISSLYRPPS